VGQGHFGRALLVQSRCDRKYYVMKALDLCRMDQQERENVVKEIRLLKMLKNPFVIGYRESFVNQTRNEICIIMEYAEKGDLEMRLRAQAGLGPFPEAQVVRWLAQISLGLAYLHRNRVMHRDLKPANILLTGANNCKIGDLGISRPLKQTDDMASTRVGTPCIMAPEVWAGEPYDRKSDLWALGCVLYELLALKPPFAAACTLLTRPSSPRCQGPLGSLRAPA
jgi:NIMA (never in mitosis gene a)-related kinase